MIEEVAPDFYRLEVPLPRNPLRSVNSYLIKGREGSLLVDTAMRTKACSEALSGLLQTLDVNLSETDLFITHMHIDHLGLAKELHAPGRKVYFGEREAEYLAKLEGWDEWLPVVEAYGFPVEGYRDAFITEESLAFSPDWWPEFTTIADGARLAYGSYEFRVVETRGHTAGHLCLYEPNLKFFLSGDHILGEISPNITGWDSALNPLGDYFDSLEKVKGLEVDLVLPGHRTPFGGLAERVSTLKAFHRRRLMEVLAILSDGRADPYKVASRMTWDIKFDLWDELPVPQRWFATGEALSHIRYLVKLGFLLETLERGRYFYSVNPDFKGTLP